MRKANFTVMNVTKTRVTIRDDGPWDQHPTVTNVAEDVVQELVESGILTPGMELFYYDSENQLDQILIKDQKFAGFRPGPRA